MKFCYRLRLSGSVTVTLIAASLLSKSLAGDYQVSGSYWSWDNQFASTSLNLSFNTGSSPQWIVSYANSPAPGTFVASIRGWNENWNPACDNLFPCRINTLASVPCSFKYAVSGPLNGAFAFDCLLRTDNQKLAPQLEVKIVTESTTVPSGTLVVSGAVKENGVTYDLWTELSARNNCLLYTFVPAQTLPALTLPNVVASASIDVMDFLDALDDLPGYDKSMYIDAVEGGFEMAGGDGSAACLSFSCQAF